LERKIDWLRVLSQAAARASMTNGKVGGGLFGLSSDLTAGVSHTADSDNQPSQAIESYDETGFVAPVLIPFTSISKCSQCQSGFGLVKRKYHCKACGLVFCASCTKQRIIIAVLSPTQPQRVCDNCMRNLQRAQHKRAVQLAKLVKDRNANVDVAKQQAKSVSSSNLHLAAAASSSSSASSSASASS